MPDALFAEPRLAEIYDVLDADRSDLEVYAALVGELGARSVLDVGCGTGVFACMLARRGLDVVAVDPAAASLEVAWRKPDAERVRWLHGDATALPTLQVDLVVMTGNVAQVFTTDGEWQTALQCVSAAIRPGGHFVFETRDPRKQAWRQWTYEHTYRRLDIPGTGAVCTWVDVTDVSAQLVSFRHSYRFEADGALLTSDSTLRFRDPDQISASLAAAGLAVQEVRDAPDRPGSSSFSSQRLDPQGCA